MFKFKFQVCSIQNFFVELALGAVPISILLWLNIENKTEFHKQVIDFILSYELQLWYVNILVFGFLIVILNKFLNLSKVLVFASFDFISAFISITQSFAGMSLIFIPLALHDKAYVPAIRFALFYPYAHFVATNLSNWLESEKIKRKRL